MTGIDRAAHLLELQRAAHRRDGPPDAALRRERLKRLERMVTGNADRFAVAIAGDFGRRPATETALLETAGTIAAIRHARRHVARWMRPARRAVGRNFWPGKAVLGRERGERA